jgi:hypothetical protein
MAPVIIDNLEKYGREFQAKIVASLLVDRIFLERVMDILDLEMFENESHRWIVKEIVEYYQGYKDLPTLQVFKVRVDTIKSERSKICWRTIS